ncbi:hypothetical protein [Olleya namhaensis]|uniref:hypothetical protein n=1 Tax=Olleya namhaensis TaxID=1144750 RepID=UPI0024927A32|nr:hypothetical protein [Olleya namhaensis]
MKQNLLHIICIAFLTLLLYNCSEENEIINENTKEEQLYTVKTISKKEYKSNQKIVKQLDKIKNTNFITWRLNDYDETYDFFVETESVKVVESIDGNYNSYTFPISKDNATNKVYNLVFSLNDNQEYESKIVEYDFSGDNSYTVGYADIELDDNDYLTRGPGTQSFSYQCVTTIHYECGWYQEVNGNTTCMNMNILSSDSSCSYSYIDSGNGGGGSGNGSGSYIWIGGGSGGGSYSSNTPPNTTTTNPDIGSSYNGPSFTKPFLMFLSGLTPTQQDFVDNTLGLKFQLQEFYNNLDNAVTTESTIEDIINTLMANPDLSFEDTLEEIIWDEVNLFPEDLGGEEITDIIDYLSCFDLSQPAEVTIYVDQPKPNSPDPYRIDIFGFDIDVGHTFISIKQGLVTRVFGYYPIPDTINPSNNPSENIISCSSILRNDSDHSFDVSITNQNITSEQLTNIYNSAISSNPTYNLNTYNCTDFGIDLGNEAGLNLPSTDGTWPRGGNGSNPGNLGQDIRNMEIPEGEGIDRNTESGESSSNSGSC